MITLNVFFDLKQESEAEFVKLLNHMIIESNKEGCRRWQTNTARAPSAWCCRAAARTAAPGCGR